MPSLVGAWPCTLHAHAPTAHHTPHRAARQRTGRHRHRAAPARLAAGGGGARSMVPNGIQWARMGVHAAARPSAFNAIERAFYFRAAAWHGVHACNAPGAPLLIFRQGMQAVLPFGMVLELGNSAGAYCAVAQAQSLSQVKSSQVNTNSLVCALVRNPVIVIS